ncbi:hypothetical protein NODU109028_07990 [Nocardioides dubius]|uniref:Neocarzinostatin family protein n=1 Tax=Nocardioides dubius TaxID=317019 RepID=A0ABP4EFW8_9ACTN
MHRSVLTSVAATAALALSASLVTASPASAAVRKVVVKSAVTIEGFNGAEESAVNFHGKVKVKRQKRACLRNRAVTLRQTDQRVVAGKDKTDRTGEWVVTFDGATIEPGAFKVSVTRKVVRAKGKRIVCKAATRSYTWAQLEPLQEASSPEAP